MKPHKGGPPIHNVGDRMGMVVIATPRPLYSQEDPITHCTRGLGEPWGRFGRIVKISLPTDFRTQNRPARCDSLYWLWDQKVLPVRCKGCCRKELCTFAGHLSRRANVAKNSAAVSVSLTEKELCVMTHYWLACCFWRHCKWTGRVVDLCRVPQWLGVGAVTD